MPTKVEKRFLKAVRSSGLVTDQDVERVVELQRFAEEQGRKLPVDRIFLKLKLLDRDEILGLWRALRYYLWRREDKFYVKLAVQSAILTQELGETCLKEQKRAYKHENTLVRVNEIARQRGYLGAPEDRALVRAMFEKNEELTLAPVDEDTAGQAFEQPSHKAARKHHGEDWKDEARQRDLQDLKAFVDSDEVQGISDEDLDALWDEADLDDIELDSQAVDLARPALFEEDEEDFDPKGSSLEASGLDDFSSEDLGSLDDLDADSELLEDSDLF